ncbi:hypothetical protein ABPG75_013711 [Micractinium tetrahymenae]
MRLLACLSCCGGDQHGNGGDQYLQPLNLLQPQANSATVDELVEQSAAARERVWRSLGSLEPFALGQSPGSSSLMAGPKWPAVRQNFRVIHRPSGNVMIVSDGLSDPFNDIHDGENNVNGFGLEFFIETPADEIGTSLSDIKKSWQFQLLYTVSQLAAGHGGISNIIDDMQLLSTEAEGVADAIPEEKRRALVNRAGRVGALLGLTDTRLGAADYVPERIEGMPLTEVRLVNIKLITLTELKLITDRGAEGRRKLSELLAGEGRLVSSIERESVI